MDKDRIEDHLLNGRVVFEANMKQYYIFPKHAVNNWDIETIITDWFIDNDLNFQSHATRTYYRNIKEIDNIIVYSDINEKPITIVLSELIKKVKQEREELRKERIKIEAERRKFEEEFRKAWSEKNKENL